MFAKARPTCHASSSSSSSSQGRGDDDGAPPGRGDPEEAGAAAEPPATPPGKKKQGSPAAPTLREKLADLGIAGIVAYGLLNTLYYTVAFLFFYLCVINPPRGLGYAVAVRKLAEAAALTWAGSQVTKIPRIAAAVAIAPFIDRLLDFASRKTGASRDTATALVVAGCFLLAASIFGILVALWA